MELYTIRQEGVGGPWVFRVNGQVKDTGAKDMVYAYAFGYLTQHIYTLQGKDNRPARVTEASMVESA